jgi:hypothetical protein
MADFFKKTFLSPLAMDIAMACVQSCAMTLGKEVTSEIVDF